MTLNDILKIGDPKLYEISEPVKKEEVSELLNVIHDMHGLVLQFREKYGAGRAIAAPQIALMKRIVCMNTDQRYTIINPVLSNFSEELFELWDDCFCFPDLLVKVRRHRSCTLTFRDEHWQEHIWHLKDDLSELLQHEYDHLNGILATQRAIDGQAFKWRDNLKIIRPSD